MERDEIHVVGRVDCLCCTEDVVCHWDTTTEYGGVFYVVHPDSIAVLAMCFAMRIKWRL